MILKISGFEEGRFLKRITTPTEDNNTNASGGQQHQRRITTPTLPDMKDDAPFGTRLSKKQAALPHYWTASSARLELWLSAFMPHALRAAVMRLDSRCPVPFFFIFFVSGFVSYPQTLILRIFYK